MDIQQLKIDYSVALSMDGNCGCALLGPNLQDGEAEFVCIDDAPEVHKGNVKSCERWAMAQAHKRLCKRLGEQLRYHYTEGY